MSTVTADRTGKFVLLIYSLTASHQTAVHCCSTEAHLVPVPFHALLTCASEKSPVLRGHKDIRRCRVLINVFLVKKKKGQKRQF